MKKFNKKFVAIAISLCCMLSAMPQSIFTSATNYTLYEAENASYSNNSIYNDSDASGGKCVGKYSSSSSKTDFTVTVEKNGFYDITVCAKGIGSSKYNKLIANGTNYGEFYSAQDTYSEATVKQVYLNSGTNTVSVTKSWGWIYLDYIKVQTAEVLSDNTYDVSKELINSNATDSTKRLMSYLVDNYGKNVLTGQQADNGYNSNEVTAIYNLTGKKPAVIGLDLMDYSLSSVTQHSSKGKSMNIAKQVDQEGGIVTVCWHWRMYDEYLLSGTADDGNPRWWQAFYTKNIDSSKFNLANIMNDTTCEAYKKILADIDYAAEQLKTLQQADIPVLFRPLHEASGGWFWWGAYGSDAYIKLWKLMYDRMTNYHGLNNLIWVWNGQDASWYPGDEYCDIMGEDIYTDKHNYAPQASKFTEVASRSKDQNKIVTLSENGVLFDIDLAIEANTLWSWFCVWGGSFASNGSSISTTYTSSDMWKKVYQHENAITLDELPNLKTYPLDNNNPTVPDDSSSTIDDSSSTIDESEISTIKYQLADNASKIRFIWIVDENSVSNATSGSIKVDVSPDMDLATISNTTPIISAYRNLYVAGKIVNAPENKVFIISPTTHNLTETTSIICEFILDSLDGKYQRTYEAS